MSEEGEIVNVVSDEKKSKKRGRKHKSSDVSSIALESIAPVQGTLGSATVLDERAMNRALLGQYEREAQMAEREEREERKRKLMGEKANAKAHLRDLERDFDVAMTTKKALARQRLDKSIEVQKIKIRALEKEDKAIQELELMELRDGDDGGDDERLVSQGLLTPMDGEKPVVSAASSGFQTNNRRGTWKDDMEDKVYAARIQAWKSGEDIREEEEEEQEEQEVGEVEEDHVGANLTDGSDGGDESDGGDADNDLDLFEAEPDFNLAPVDLEGDLEFDGNLGVFSACRECLKTRGLEEVLTVLGKSYETIFPLYCLPALLKDCRFNTQRALNLIFSTSEAQLRALYPPVTHCEHLPEQRLVPPKQKKPLVRKSSVPQPLALVPVNDDGGGGGGGGDDDFEVEEPRQPWQDADVVFDDTYRIPLTTYNCLFDYQRTGVRWLWELHKQQVGGILADEMGLGKSIQTASFLLGLAHSGLLQQPVLLLCPATVMKQWVSELHKWAPSFRVIVLHASSGGATSNKDSKLLKVMHARGNGILVTTYDAFRRAADTLQRVQWSYAILDEGHKIRNPDRDITLAAKKINTHHRIMLTGTPIQNSLRELWSLMDFVYPGKLGTLPVFQREFEVPIQVGGYASASPSQVVTAYRCSVVLKDLIKPFLLRRLKVDVDVELPNKTEQVIMCHLRPEQVDAYRAWLRSDEMQRILTGKLNALYGISFLRKICNHPDLLQLQRRADVPRYGDYHRSAKMLVLHEMFPIWKQQGHRVLLFTQGVQMLDIIEQYVKEQGYSYLRLDGTTSVQARIPLIDQYNQDESIFAFLLTTRVGGIGINLTGADRVVIFDPDWNPSTDLQARERAWRIGQKREVTVYRLVTSGTIEEKVLHRQIFKTFLTQKILKNPRQRRIFGDAKDLSDLFTLGVQYSSVGQGMGNETARLFHHIKSEVDVAPPNRDAQQGDRDDDVLLRTLLSKHQGVISALNHDAMVEGQPADYDILHKEGEAVARKAVENLQKSQSAVFRAPITAPTWTGQHGEAGVAPRFGRTISALKQGTLKGIRNTEKRSGSSLDLIDPQVERLVVANKPGGIGSVVGSSQLLSSIKKRKGASEHISKNEDEDDEGDNGSRAFALDDEGVPQDAEDRKGLKLASDLRRFLWANGGSCGSDEVVDMFKARLDSVEDKFAFRQILQSLAVLDKRKKLWVLKDQWK